MTESNAGALDVTIIGGGMITNDLILPSVYHLQRTGVAADISICALNSPPLAALKENAEMREAFPGQDFTAYPDLSEPADAMYPDLYKQVLADMKPRQAVVVAVPDQFHYATVKEALARRQNVLCVKPLVLKYEQAIEVEDIAREEGLYVGVEYHKRFDRRSLIARREYELGRLGDFKMAEAKLVEPWFYRHSNFQNWFTVDQTDPFVYIGCHYVDLLYFITGLKPVEVQVSGVTGAFPNGKEGYMWSHGLVRFENGGMLSVINGLGYPDGGGGSNDQCLVVYGEGDDVGTIVKHNDQFRGVSHGYVSPSGSGDGKHFHFINPDFYRLVPWEGEGFKPVGYGYDSVAANISMMHRMESEVAGLPEAEALEQRRAFLKAVDEKGIIATPANSSINELVVEAARMSILSDGLPVRIVYGDRPHVGPR